MILGRKINILKNKLISLKETQQFSTVNHDIDKILKTYYKKNQLIPGFATQSGTEKYAQRFLETKQVHQTFYSKVSKQKKKQPQKDQNLYLSNLGIGTQNGQPNPADDSKMIQILIESLTNGINFIDTDINFRYGKSQKIINAAINYLTNQCGYDRNQFFINTKLGYVPTDVDSQLTSEKVISILKNQGYLKDQNIVENIYGWGQGFIDFCVEKSRLSLGVQTIDNLLLNNFSQAQMALVTQSQFENRLKVTFKKLEDVRKSKRIKNYGICSFVGLRSPPNEEGVHLNLQKISNFVKNVVGADNGFKYIMLPLNLGMPQALLKWQKYSLNNKQQVLRVFDVAQKQNLKIILCSPLFQGRVATLPFSSPKLNYINSNAGKHLQFIRSINSKALVSTVFSTLNPIHLKQNLQVLKHGKVSQQDWKSILPIPQ